MPQSWQTARIRAGSGRGQGMAADEPAALGGEQSCRGPAQLEVLHAAVRRRIGYDHYGVRWLARLGPLQSCGVMVRSLVSRRTLWQ